MFARRWRSCPRVLAALALLITLLATTPAAARNRDTGTYQNPLPVQIPGNGLVESCADPSLIKGQQEGDTNWYMYCTKDPLNDEDRNAQGEFNFRNLPMLSSSDLVNWTYVGDAFPEVPAWGEPTAGVWAPEIQFLDGQYYLYYVLTDTDDDVSGAPGCGGDSAIGVATSASPTGPWQDLGRPVVEPRYNGAPRDFGARECNFFWTFDPEVLTADGQRYIYYGSYYGGIQVRPLSADGLTTDPAQATQVAIPNRYEGAELIERGGAYYMFVSAGNCCNGPVTGYSVFVGRSASPLGPFVDREGVSFLETRVGGTPSIVQNGNRWVGVGHNSVFRDLEGQWWTVYHGIDVNEPYFAGTNNFTKRPVLLDELVWVGGWPVLRAGLGPSDEPQAAPAAQPGDKSRSRHRPPQELRLGRLLFADQFRGDSLGDEWSWVREPDPASYGVSDGDLRLATQDADLFEGNNSASVLTLPAVAGDYVVETRVRLDVPAEGCCFNFVQAGVLIYGDDDSYVRLMHVSIWETRQVEFAKEFVEPGRGPHFGGTLGGPPSEWTRLRILKRTVDGQELYTAYSRREDGRWVRAGTWTHALGEGARIGLAAMGGSGFTATFDYVRVYEYRRGL